MTVKSFDRVRPRTPRPDSAMTAARDAQGKRALFSSTESVEHPAAGTIIIDCSRCSQRTLLTAVAAMRVFFPAFHLSLGIGRGDRESTVGLLRGRRYGSWLRCPACGRGSWVRVTIQL